MSRIKSIFKRCNLRVVTPIDNGMVGVGFNLENGEVIRLCIPVDVVDDIYRLTTSQSPGSITGNFDQKTENIFTARDKFIKEYCAKKSWTGELSSEQILEIRQQDGWKNPKGV